MGEFSQGAFGSKIAPATFAVVGGLAAAPGSRIINLSSDIHKQGGKDIQWNDIMFEKKYKSVDAYAQSKLANLLFNLELSKRVKGKKCCSFLSLFGVGGGREGSVTHNTGLWQKKLTVRCIRLKTRWLHDLLI